MNVFLQGFADELVKVGASPLPKPMAVGTPGGPARPKAMQTGAMRSPQRMESPAAAPKPQRWRPTSGYKADASTDPVAAAPKKRGRRGPKKKTDTGETTRGAFESDSKFKARKEKNLAENKALDASRNAPAGGPSNSEKRPERMASFSSKPNEAPIGGKRKFDKSVSKETRSQVQGQDKATSGYQKPARQSNWSPGGTNRTPTRSFGQINQRQSSGTQMAEAPQVPTAPSTNNAVASINKQKLKLKI